MSRKIYMFLMAIFIVSILVVIVIGFMSGPLNPLPWILIAILAFVFILYNKTAKSRYLEWQDSYSVGVEVLDNDHKRLLHLINNLQTAILYQTDKEFEIQTLNEVIDYTKTHFSREEAFMEQYDYPDFEAHKATHQQMIDKVNEYVKTYETDASGTLESLLEYLKTWLIKHINGTDQEYTAYFNNKGLR